MSENVTTYKTEENEKGPLGSRSWVAGAQLSDGIPMVYFGKVIQSNLVYNASEDASEREFALDLEVHKATRRLDEERWFYFAGCTSSLMASAV
ncbi:MAG: hypothetical protein RR934_03580 [Gordonibacter sp.]|uniref:hypothetical protein n=1 Tax=Gordonibacter sp. TaxID=1968902 RepID=UPI00321F8BCC